MADGQRPAIGLSIGATNLAAITAERAVTRKSVLTLHARHESEVGTPPEHAEANETGLVITDFVDRVGDPDEVVATDGSTHRGETLAAEALRALAYTATDGRPLPEAVAVTHPVHWDHTAVSALGTALARVPEWSARMPASAVVSDATAALVALQVNPGLPSRGILAVCDFGGSGSSCTLVDADNGYQPVAPALRYTDLSGHLIDKALVAHVIAELSRRGSFDTSATSALGSLTQLRAACRDAKEALSSSPTATVSVDLPGTPGDIRLTRNELADIIAQPLDGFCSAVRETIHDSGIRAAEVTAVASIGGGASIPAVTRTLVEHLHVPVITMPRPDLSAAVGAALHAARGSTSNATAMAPAAPAAEETSLTEVGPESGFTPALAWSEAVDDDSGIMPVTTDEHLQLPSGSEDGSDGGIDEHDTDAGWYRWPVVLLIAATLLALAIAAALLIVMRQPEEEPRVPTPSETSTPAPSSATSSETPSTTTEAPETSPSPAPPPPPPPETSTPPPPPETTTQPPPPPETTTQPPPPPETTTQPPTTTQAPPPTTSQAPRTSQPSYPQYPTSRAPERPKNPFTPRNPFEPTRNPFTPRNPWFPGF